MSEDKPEFVNYWALNGEQRYFIRKIIDKWYEDFKSDTSEHFQIAINILKYRLTGEDES
jgi:hypothetical protein